MKEELIEKAKTLSGKVLVIGYNEDDKLVKTLFNNKKVVDTTFLNTELSNKKNKNIKSFYYREKKVYIKSLYKDLKKEQYDYIIVDFYIIRKKVNKFIFNSYKIAKKEIFIFVNEDIYDYEEIEKRYSRYGAKVTSKGKGGNYITTIDVKNMKMKFIKRFLNSFRDFFYNIYEFLANAIIA